MAWASAIEFPQVEDLKYFVVSDEKTEFSLAGDHKTFWIRSDYDTDKCAYYTITNEQARTSQVALNFLNPKTQYVAIIYADAPNATGRKNRCPTRFKVSW